MKDMPAQLEWGRTENLLRPTDPLRFPELRSLNVLQKNSWSFRQLTEWNHNIKQIEVHHGLLLNWNIIAFILDICDSPICNWRPVEFTGYHAKDTGGYVCTRKLSILWLSPGLEAQWHSQAHAHRTELSCPPGLGGYILTSCKEWFLALRSMLRTCWGKG